jgi:hypothetical protein
MKSFTLGKIVGNRAAFLRSAARIPWILVASGSIGPSGLTLEPHVSPLRQPAPSEPCFSLSLPCQGLHHENLASPIVIACSRGSMKVPARTSSRVPNPPRESSFGSELEGTSPSPYPARTDSNRLGVRHLTGSPFTCEIRAAALKTPEHRIQERPSSSRTTTYCMVRHKDLY